VTLRSRLLTLGLSAVFLAALAVLWVATYRPVPVWLTATAAVAILAVGGVAVSSGRCRR
jgi:hypothetical protein